MVLGLPLGVLWRMRLHGAQKFLQSRLNTCNVQLAPLYILKLQRKQTSQFHAKPQFLCLMLRPLSPGKISHQVPG
jgi:hypothetical protein